MRKERGQRPYTEEDHTACPTRPRIPPPPTHGPHSNSTPVGWDPHGPPFPLSSVARIIFYV